MTESCEINLPCPGKSSPFMAKATEYSPAGRGGTTQLTIDDEITVVPEEMEMDDPNLQEASPPEENSWPMTVMMLAELASPTEGTIVHSDMEPKK